MLHLPYSPPVPVLQQPPRAPSELPEKQKQAAPACPTDPEGPGLIKAPGLHGSAQCTVLWGLSEASWEGSGSTSALGFHIANSSRGRSFSQVFSTLLWTLHLREMPHKERVPNNSGYVEFSLKQSPVAACDRWDKFSGGKRMWAS